MLSKFDDYPIHQTPEPLAVSATTDRHAYDRFWFNGYTDDGSLYFGIGGAVYPNLGIMDGALSVVYAGYKRGRLCTRCARRHMRASSLAQGVSLVPRCPGCRPIAAGVWQSIRSPLGLGGSSCGAPRRLGTVPSAMLSPEAEVREPGLAPRRRRRVRTLPGRGGARNVRVRSRGGS